MQITDLTEDFYRQYFCCLEEWSDEMKEAGDHKEKWYHQMKDKGLRVKIAIENDTVCAMIQYIPVEYSFARGRDLYFIKCIWVHGHKKGIGDYQKRGIGTALLEAAEADVKSMKQKGMAVWGMSLPFWMKAAWFKKHGYKKADKQGMSVLLWKPFQRDAELPQWIKQKKKPKAVKGQVTVTSFINGWCPAQNAVHERARRAVQEFGGQVKFIEIQTSDRAVFEEWGISDALYIDDKNISAGPPLSYESIRKKIQRKVKKMARSKG